MKVLVVLKSPVLNDVAVTAHSCLHDGTRFQITQNNLPSVELDPDQALGLLSAFNEYFNGEPVVKDPEPAEDTVALLCAAARKWAKWDARSKGPWSGGCNLDEADAHARCVEKVAKWRDRTLSYGHHLLAEPVKDETTTMCYPRLADPYMELARLDTLVQQLCARVANLEEAGG